MKWFQEYESIFNDIYIQIRYNLDLIIPREKNESKKKYKERLDMLASIKTLALLEHYFIKFIKENEN